MLKRHVWSPQLRRRLWVEVAFPPGYTRLKPPFDALVFLDAQSAFTNRGAWGGCHVDSIAADLFRRRLAPPLVIIGVFSPSDRDRTYGPPPDGRADRMADFLSDTLLSAIRERVPLARDPARVGVAGFSFGANMAIQTGLRRPDRFGLVCALSAAPHWIGPQVGDLMAARRRLPMRRLYIDCGTMLSPDMRHVDDSNGFNRWLMDVARARLPQGAFLGRVCRGGFHTEFSWRRRLPRALRFLYT